MDQTINGFYPQTTIATGDLVPFYDINGSTGQTTCKITLANFKSQIFASPILTGATTISGLNIGSSSDLTIASGAITITSSMIMINIDTEGSAATDDLTDINPLVLGQVIILRTTNTNRDVTLKTTGNIYIPSDITLSSPHAAITLKGGALKWNVISYYNGV